jgi:hypothetical protein
MKEPYERALQQSPESPINAELPQLEGLGHGQDAWLATHTISDHLARCSSEAGYHTILGGTYDEGCPIEEVVASKVSGFGFRVSGSRVRRLSPSSWL